MPVNYYLMPLVGTGVRGDEFRCKYATSLAAFAWDSARMGQELAFLVMVRDIDAATDATIAGDAACTVIPPLGNTVGGALATVQAKLEALNIPADWVTAGMTYATVIRFTFIFFQLHQRLHGIGAARLLTGPVTLNTTFASLGAGVRAKLLAMAESFEFDKSSLSGSSTIRQILKALANQWPRTNYLGGEAL